MDDANNPKTSQHSNLLLVVPISHGLVFRFHNGADSAFAGGKKIVDPHDPFQPTFSVDYEHSIRALELFPPERLDDCVYKRIRRGPRNMPDHMRTSRFSWCCCAS